MDPLIPELAYLNAYHNSQAFKEDSTYELALYTNHLSTYFNSPLASLAEEHSGTNPESWNYSLYLDGNSMDYEHFIEEVTTCYPTKDNLSIDSELPASSQDAIARSSSPTGSKSSYWGDALPSESISSGMSNQAPAVDVTHFAIPREASENLNPSLTRLQRRQLEREQLRSICPLCSKSFCDARAVQRHLDRGACKSKKRDSSREVCSCGKSFSRPDALIRHVRAKHKPEDDEIDDDYVVPTEYGPEHGLKIL